MKKQGFTLAEILLVMAVVATIATIVLPSLSSAKPNKDLLMFRKAYYRVERAITELVNDDVLYPDPEDQSENLYLGNTTAVPFRGKEYEGPSKFCGLLAAKLGANDENCGSGGPNPGFTTSDGISWIVPDTNFNTPFLLMMDINGLNTLPNCNYVAKNLIKSSTSTNTCTEPDRFVISVSRDGRITVAGEMEKEYLLRKNTTIGAGFETMADPRKKKK